MTVYEAMVTLGFDPDAKREYINVLDLRHMRKRLEAERETASGNAKRRKTKEIRACDKLIEHLTKSIW